MITDEKAKKYVEELGGKCPNCKSTEIYDTDIRENTNTACIHQDMACDVCEVQWTDTYKLTHCDPTNI